MQEKIKSAIDNYLKNKHYSRLNLKTAMFDMDGVLYDSMKYHSVCWQKAMKHFGMHMTAEEVYQNEGRTGFSTVNIVSKRQRGYETTEEEVATIYKYKSDLFNQCPKAEAMPGAKDILTKVKHSGIQPMVITGSGQHTLLDRLNADYPNIFKDNLIVTAFDVKLGKPNPEPYLMGMKKAGDITPEQSFVVENAPLGVKAGVAAGCFTIAVNTGPLKDSELYDSGADIVFDSMSQLADNWELILSELEKTH